MKPFNLEEALSGKAVLLRNGSKAYVRHHETEFPVEEDMRLIGILPDGYRLSWCENGDYYTSSSTSDYDIIGMYPETRIINGFEVPEPETVAPGAGSLYFTPNLILKKFFDVNRWGTSECYNLMLSRGLVFLNKEDAIATAKAMLGIDPNKGEK